MKKQTKNYVNAYETPAYSEESCYRTPIRALLDLRKRVHDFLETTSFATLCAFFFTIADACSLATIFSTEGTGLENQALILTYVITIAIALILNWVVIIRAKLKLALILHPERLSYYKTNIRWCDLGFTILYSATCVARFLLPSNIPLVLMILLTIEPLASSIFSYVLFTLRNPIKQEMLSIEERLCEIDIEEIRINKYQSIQTNITQIYGDMLQADQVLFDQKLQQIDAEANNIKEAAHLEFAAFLKTPEGLTEALSNRTTTSSLTTDDKYFISYLEDNSSENSKAV